MSFYQYYLSIPRKCNNEIKLVIFDKDGTLINHEKIFGKWLIQLVENFPKTILPNKNQLYNHLGYNPIEDTFQGNSIVARGTNEDIRNIIYEFFVSNGEENIVRNTSNDASTSMKPEVELTASLSLPPLDDLKELIQKYWIDIEFTKDDILQCGDIIKVFKYLQSKNIKIGICTSDDRQPTVETVEMLNLSEYVEDIKCGDDPISSKPAPEPIWEICSNLDIDVSNCLMIGDTISDIHGGINAKCGKVVGVLSGGYDNADLGHADKILNSIDELPEYLEEVMMK